MWFLGRSSYNSFPPLVEHSTITLSCIDDGINRPSPDKWETQCTSTLKYNIYTIKIWNFTIINIAIYLLELWISFTYMRYLTKQCKWRKYLVAPGLQPRGAIETTQCKRGLLFEATITLHLIDTIHSDFYEAPLLIIPHYQT